MISVTPIQVSLNWCIDERMAERLYCWVIESRLYRNQSIHLGKASFLAEILEALSHSGTYYYEQIYDPGEKINLYSLQESWKDFRKNELIGIFSPNNRESGPRN